MFSSNFSVPECNTVPRKRNDIKLNITEIAQQKKQACVMAEKFEFAQDVKVINYEDCCRLHNRSNDLLILGGYNRH